MGMTAAEAMAAMKKGGTTRPRPKLAVVSSADLPFWAEFRMVVLAPPGDGKTHLGFTASAAYPDEWPPKAPVTLDDIVFVETDSAGLVPAIEAGVTVPRVISLSGCTDEELTSLVEDLPAFLAAEVAKAPTRAVIIDTGSTLFNAVAVTKVSMYEGPRAYNELAKIVRTFASAIKALPCPVIYNMHIKPPQVIMDQAEAKRQAEGAMTAAGLDPGQLPMDLAGRDAAKAIRNHSTLGALLKTTQLPGGKTQRELDFASRTVEGKMRLSVCVNKVEPAHLGKLFAKIAAGCGVAMPGLK